MTPAEAVERARTLLGKGHPYVLGGGNREGPTRVAKKDQAGKIIGYTVPGFDCWGFADAWSYDHPRHDPGFNVGPWATVQNDRNCDSAIEDAEHTRQRYAVIDRPELGCLLVMPSVRDPKTKKRIRIGHVWITSSIASVLEWDPAHPQYQLLETLQCQASKSPAVRLGAGPLHDGRTFRGETRDEWRIRMLRVL